MFLREIKSKGKKYLNIVESYREEGKIKQRYIASFGCINYLNNAQLKKLGLSLIRYCKEDKNIFDISEIEEKDRKIWGPVKIFRKLWDLYQLDELFSTILRNRRIKFDFFSATFLMLLDRLSEPGSKLRSYARQDKYYGIKDNLLHHLYRALDILAAEKENIEKSIFERQKNLFNMKIDVVLYDVTTIYFESSKADSLKEFGFSKDCKINEVQIILGLLLDVEGSPIGFDIFPGNKFEGHTLESAIKKLRQKFEIERIIFVGDQAMMLGKNIDIIRSAGYEYVVGGRIKNRSNEIKEKILNGTGYVRIKDKDEEGVFKYKVIDLGEDNLISSWSSKRSIKDKKDRDRLIEKAKKLIEGKGEIISRRGALRYIGLDQKLEPKLLEEKIREDERWDGYYGIQTNCKDIDGLKVINMYHDLWRIEEAFRMLKSHLEARPIFHWTPKRIKGHLVLCFVAFLLERRLEIELKRRHIEYSPEKIRWAINELQFSIIEINGQLFYIRSKVEGLANEILRVLKIKIPDKIFTPEDF